MNELCAQCIRECFPFCSFCVRREKEAPSENPVKAQPRYPKKCWHSGQPRPDHFGPYCPNHPSRRVPVQKVVGKRFYAVYSPAAAVGPWKAHWGQLLKRWPEIVAGVLRWG